MDMLNWNEVYRPSTGHLSISLWSFFNLRKNVIIVFVVSFSNFSSYKKLIFHQNFWKVLLKNPCLLSLITAYIISCIKVAWKIHIMLMCRLWMKFNTVRHSILFCKQKIDLIKHYLFHIENLYNHEAYFRHLTLWSLKLMIWYYV